MKKYKFIIINILLLGLLISINFNIKNVYANNSETSFQNPNIVENIDYNEGMNFEFLSFVKLQNDKYSFVYLLPMRYSNWLRCTDFNFNLPDNSIIKGIKVQIDDFNGYYDYILVQDIYLVLNGIKIGIDKEIGTPIGTSDTDTYRVYGSSIDIWNTELSKSDIESSTFGLQILYYNSHTFIEFNVNIDNIQIKIYYSISEPEPELNIDFIIIFNLLAIFSIMILILMFTIIIIKK